MWSLVEWHEEGATPNFVPMAVLEGKFVLVADAQTANFMLVAWSTGFFQNSGSMTVIGRVDTERPNNNKAKCPDNIKIEPRP